MVAAGIFVSTARFFALHELAWPSELRSGVGNSVYWGFFFVAGLLLVLGGIAGFLASKWLRSGPPTPDMAIDEAQRIRETLTGEPSGPAAWFDAVSGRNGGSQPR